MNDLISYRNDSKNDEDEDDDDSEEHNDKIQMDFDGLDMQF